MSIADPEKPEKTEVKDFLVPIPDAIRDGDTPFSFRPGPPNINLEQRTMSSPVELSEHTRQAQLRELGHAKWSPENRRVPGISPAILESVEHARINTLLACSSFELNERAINDADIDYVMKHGDIVGATTMMLSATNSADYNEVRKKFVTRYSNLLADRIDHAMQSMVHREGDYFTPDWTEYFTWDTAVESAKDVQNILREFVEDKEKKGKQPPPKQHAEQPDDDEVLSTLIPGGKIRDAGGTKWSEMEIEEPVRPIKMKVDLKARKTIKSDTGAVPIAIHRAMIDGRVFRAKRRMPGAGSVLIDQSGSMSMTQKNVETIMAALPGVVIAGYCTSGVKGRLRILAKRGKRVADKALLINGGGNGCDGTALEWLSQQPAPRFWVSDGGITALHGRGDGEATPVAALVEQVRDLQIKYHILRVPTADSLALRLARKEKMA